MLVLIFLSPSQIPFLHGKVRMRGCRWLILNALIAVLSIRSDCYYFNRIGAKISSLENLSIFVVLYG